jgi:hypothetical protein
LSVVIATAIAIAIAMVGPRRGQQTQVSRGVRSPALERRTLSAPKRGFESIFLPSLLKAVSLLALLALVVVIVTVIVIVLLAEETIAAAPFFSMRDLKCLRAPPIGRLRMLPRSPIMPVRK